MFIKKYTQSPFVKITLLAAIWGSSFLFMRILVPQIGSYWTAFLRVVFGASFLYAVLLFRRQNLEIKKYWKSYLIVGLLSTALPFMLYTVASRALPAGYMAVLNSTVPYWATVLSFLWFGERVPFTKLLGLILGFSGVILLVQLSAIALDAFTIFAVIACLVATLSYGVAACFLKIWQQGAAADSYRMAAGAQFFSVLLFLPGMGFADKTLFMTPVIFLQFILLGCVCTGFAYLLYFPLVKTAGVVKSSLVTFLIPVFAFLWGYIFLGEVVTLQSLLGAAIVLLGTAVVLYAKPSPLEKNLNA